MPHCTPTLQMLSLHFIFGLSICPSVKVMYVLLTGYSRTQYKLMEIQGYVVKALFKHFFKVLQPISLILNIHKIIRGYPVCEIEILQVTVNEIEVFSFLG